MTAPWEHDARAGALQQEPETVLPKEPRQFRGGGEGSLPAAGDELGSQWQETSPSPANSLVQEWSGPVVLDQGGPTCTT